MIRFILCTLHNRNCYVHAPYPLLRPPAPCTEYSAPPSTSASTVYRVQCTPFYVRQHRVQSPYM